MQATKERRRRIEEKVLDEKMQDVLGERSETRCQVLLSRLWNDTQLLLT